MSGRHRKPTNTQLRLAKAGALTMMATLPLTLASAAFAAEASAKDRDSSGSGHDTRYADEYDSYLSHDSDSDDEDNGSRARNSRDRDTAHTFSRSDYLLGDDDDADDDSDGRSSSRARGRHAATHETDDLPLIGRHASHRGKSSRGHSALRQERDPAVPTAHAAKWDKLAQCESTQNWDANTGNGFKGGLQFTDSTWRAYGGHRYAPTANQASRTEQIAVAEKVRQGQGWGAWPSCSRKLGYA
ncbi:MAG TPA: transglycosylase family protein [Pseudonocardia sp.]|jgi:hypothetical protein|nr:transglycosylase family protein [Pseudonocardia sp.]